MARERVERRLAAILAADVAGYSRLMGADEVGTLAALKAIRREVVRLRMRRNDQMRESWSDAEREQLKAWSRQLRETTT